MRIGTIHAFCQSLLRRFPLEAAISPHFRLADDRDSTEALDESREAMLADPETSEDALAELAGITTLKAFGGLVAALSKRGGEVEAAARLGAGLEAAYRRAVGVTVESEAAAMEAAIAQGRGLLREAAAVVARRGSNGCRDRAMSILGWIDEPRAERWDEWRTLFLKQDGGARAASTFVNTKLAAAEPHLAAAFADEAERIRAVDDQLRALRLARASAALVRLAAPVLVRYEERKARSGLLDYDDLIGLTSRLLVDPGAAWVLYKLDGGLDHLLLDEVQDTAPEQWRIAHALTAEFFAGEGVRRTPRTVFAVGDRKQSIFSFQGADAAGFDASRVLMRERAEAAGGVFRDVPMDVSFRSTEPVLKLVDAVFADPEASAGVSDAPIKHFADRTGFAGSVELWPLTPADPPADPGPWAVPERNEGFSSAPQRLAETLGRWIASQTNGSVMLQSKGRPLAPGDVLVLLRRRGQFDRSLLRALKQARVPVAGLDRLTLTEQPAVADLLSLCDVLLLPEDDLSLACVLKSPLGGCDEDSLLELAAGREASLWAELGRRAGERADWMRAYEMIAGLLSRVDYATPHALLSEALGARGGRALLFARLGAEAAEPVDELLNAALTYQASHPPSLQGFLHWLRRSGAVVKREAEGAGGAVRIMTVHGAKGLQAPLVILPDTIFSPSERDEICWTSAGGRALPLWTPRKEFSCEAAAAVRQAARLQRAEEENRLLYVALTRAEDRLLVCGWEPRRAPSATCWHTLAARGFERLGASRRPFEAWAGDALLANSPQVATLPPHAEVAAAERIVPPGWAGRAPEWTADRLAAEPALPLHLAPSRPQDSALGLVPHAASPLTGAGSGARFLRGKLVHQLLQHLPELPREARAGAAARWLARPAHAVADGDGLVQEIIAILDHPALAPLFGPGSRAEAPLTGVIGDRVIGGLVDRLAVLPERVLVADYKTNREPPASVEETPVLYLRQMAAYRAVLRAIHPGRAVGCALVWTRAARVDVLPDALLDAHAPAA
jgi:ATP-dependent helicase/nuclease subunit A